MITHQIAVSILVCETNLVGWKSRGGYKNIEELQFIVKNLCIRRLKKDILPEHYRQKEESQFTRSIKNIKDEIRKEKKLKTNF